MPSKVFDILPPRDKPRTYRHHNEGKKEKKKSKRAFLFFFFGVLIIGFCYIFIKVADNTAPQKTGTDVIQTPSTDTSKESFELFNDTGDSKLTESGIVTIRLQDGSLSATNFQMAKDKLLAAGFQLEKTEKSANPYDKTMIYYKKGQIAQANRVNDILKLYFSTQLSESANLAETYDCLVIIGKS